MLILKITYDEILNNMKNVFYEKSGENVDLMSDLGARFQAVASELYSLSCYGDYILRQSFPQTASGTELDYHAALRDITRKSASKSSGELTFYVDEPIETELTVPKGTVCSVKDSPYIQFETSSEAVISAGETEISVSASAIAAGAQYNAKAQTITVMVDCPKGISGVRNDEAFIGGTDDETDESLRRRILSAYSVAPTGVNESAFEQAITRIDDVVDCKFMRSNALYTIYLRTKSGTLPISLSNKVSNAAQIITMAGCYSTTKLASELPTDLCVYINKSAFENEKLKSALIEEIKRYFDRLKIGESLNLNKLIYSLMRDESLTYCNITDKNGKGGSVWCYDTSYLTPGEIKVVAYDE